LYLEGNKTVAINAGRKKRDVPFKGNHLQDSMGIKGPSGKPGAGSGKKRLGESMHIGSSTGSHSNKEGRNHLRDSMGL
jgi:hypothetical protein